MHSSIDLVILGVPLQWWFVLPPVVLILYGVFRWRRFGENAFTWNHEYFKLAGAFGMALCVAAAASAIWLTAAWQYAGVWTGILIAVGLTLRFARYQTWTNTVILSVAMVAVGLGSIPAANSIKEAFFRPVKQRPRAALADVPRLTFAPDFPAGWQEQPGRSPHAYKRNDSGSGILQISLYPPSDATAPTGVTAEMELADALDAVVKDMPLGARTSLAHAEAAAGPMAFADYHTDKHGPVRFWMILSKVRIFASYTDGQSPTAEREIAEAQAVLQSARLSPGH